MKPNPKVVLLPSIVMAAVALSACNNVSTANGTEFKSTESKNVTIDEITTLNTNRTDNATVNLTGSTKEHISAEGQMIDSLTRHHWTLVAAKDNRGQSLPSLMAIKDQVMLTFNPYQGQNAVSYTVGCNMVNAIYQMQGNTMIINESMSTKMLCGDLNIAEDTLNQLMHGESQLQFTQDEDASPILTQVTSNASVLEWRGALTAQAKYNSKGETIFWAVNADTKPCLNNNTQTCLQVKPITYDDQGIKTDEGRWTEFSGKIDGYQHDSEHDEVLRLQRYQLDAADTTKAPKTAEYAYVLDTVIESTLSN